MTLTKCQRYQIELFNNTSTYQNFLGNAVAFQTNAIACVVPLPTSMRSVYPTIDCDISEESPYEVFGTSVNGYQNVIELKGVQLYDNQTNAVRLLFTSTNNDLVRGNAYQVIVRNPSEHHFLLDANL